MNSLKWNPEQYFEDDENSIHVQCRKNVKLADDILKERLKSVNLVITTLLTSLHDTTTDNMNQSFKIVIENFPKITNSTKRILEKIDNILEYIIGSPQVIILIAVASIISISSVLGVLLGAHIIKLMKTLRRDDGDNVKLIKDLCERWDRAEAMVKNQPNINSLSRTKEPPTIVGVVPFTMGNTGFIRGDANTKSICYCDLDPR